MARPLIIVESPAKARTLERFLGRHYKVLASKGHLRDLPKSQLGVDIQHGFAPRYITIRGKGEVLKELREQARKASRIYLATDPDREGEAISWHLAQVLGLPQEEALRIVFHEVTPDAVRRALKEPRPINADLVEAQKARRILDRLVGYELSPLLWRKVRRGLSAGRVQSAALRLVVQREEEIEAFTPRTYFTLHALLGAGEEGDAVFLADYVGDGERAQELDDPQEVEALLARLSAAQEAQVEEVHERERRRRPPPPFTTSTLQQEASRRLGFTVRRTMAVVQSLYEGEEVPGEGRVGLVTYIRTDSTRVAEPARAEAATFIQKAYGTSFLPDRARAVKDAPQSQGAHEAIRPTSVARRPEMLEGVLRPEAYRLYRLIWERFVASQMADARYRVRTVVLTADGLRLRASASSLEFPGFLTLYGEGAESDEEGSVAPSLPAHLAPGVRVPVVEARSQSHTTQPPPRYTEASLVKTLEELGIGRPSTYAPILETLTERGYVERRERTLWPTQLGRLVDAMLCEHFPDIVDPKFTAHVEAALDRVEQGEESSQRLLESFYQGFHAEVERAEKAIGKVELPQEMANVACPECGRPMVVKYGRFGRFFACTGYPECKGTLPYQEPTGARCPVCGREVVARRTRRGRTFYGCSGYPQCTFTTWYRPAGKECPRCHAFLTVRRQKGRTILRCVRDECGYEEPLEETGSPPGKAQEAPEPVASATSTGGDG